ncbi:MAG: hypothetical protein HYY93_15430 [Planctomycetes bacterium]|nr:hypothetical protein [Planctomycetota bacterium]
MIPFLLALSVCSLYLLLPYPELLAPRFGEAGAWLILLAIVGVWLACATPARGARSGPGSPWPRLRAFEAALVLAFLAGFALLEWPYLTLPFAYRGDEDHHLQGARLLERALATGASREAVASSLAGWLGRYPPALLALETLCANRWLGTDTLEWTHRLTAFLPMALFALWPYLALRARGVPAAESWPALICLPFVPVVFYHAAVTYIEPLLLLVQGIVLLRVAGLDRFETRDLFEIACLASIAGVVKETSPAVLAPVAAWLAWKGLSRREEPLRRRAGVTARLLGTLLLPSLPFFLARSSDRRPYPLLLENLARSDFYAQWGAAAWSELTVGLLLLAALGFFFMAVRRRLTDLLVLGLLLLGAWGVVFSLDHLDYVGYGRFVLCLVPALSAGGVGLFLAPRDVCPIHRRSPLGRSILFAGMIAGCGAGFIPWRVGERESWGCPGSRTGEYYYDFDRAIEAAARRLPPDGSIFVYIGGGDHYYNALAFYLARHGLAGRLAGMTFGDPLAPKEAAALGKSGRPFRLMLLCHHTPSPPEPESSGGARFVERFTLGRRAIDLYEVD